LKLRKPWLIKTAGLLGTAALRWWMNTLEFRYQHLGPELVDPNRTPADRRFLYAIWHENMLLPAFQFPRRDIYVLTSRHADGQLISEVLRRLHVPVIRGSTSRGGVEAVRQALRKTGRAAHLVITPDGPRGPRRQVQRGLVYLAARTGMPIVPTGFASEHPWRLRSWDRFAVPRPWTRSTCVTAAPVTVPPDAKRGQWEEYRRRVEEALHRVSEAAECWADTGRSPQRTAVSGQRSGVGLSSVLCPLSSEPGRNLTLQREEAIAIVPPHLFAKEPRGPWAAAPPLKRWVRVALVVIAAALVGVFTVAVYLDPYNPDGTPRDKETHRQLGFPRCTFYDLTGVPCPSCGMTTSFALLVRGDVLNSLRANSVGTLLAVFCLGVIPWALASVYRGRLCWVRSLERSLTVLLTIFLFVLLLRWGLVLWLGWAI
jgi:lysophospholipid acyltransferase (LPLAT)-like uncharacterized protein